MSNRTPGESSGGVVVAHDPMCKYAKTPKEVEWHLCACCAWVKEIRADQDRRRASELNVEAE